MLVIEIQNAFFTAQGEILIVNYRLLVISMLGNTYNNQIFAKLIYK